MAADQIKRLYYRMRNDSRLRPLLFIDESLRRTEPVKG